MILNGMDKGLMKISCEDQLCEDLSVRMRRKKSGSLCSITGKSVKITACGLCILNVEYVLFIG